MARLPEPLVPPDCDCKGLPFMPLEVVRLRESDLAALSTGDEFKAAVLLWAASWTQAPAASLPDDDRILARLAGYSLAEWSGLREMSLKGWVKCSDQRLYHPLIADLAAAAHAKRRGQKERADTRWQREKTRANAGLMPRHPETDATAYENPSHGTATAMQGTGTVEGTVPPKAPQGADRDIFTEALNAYPEAGRVSTTPDKAKSAWDVACRTETPERLLQAVRAFAAQITAQADRANRIPSFQRWLTDKRFAVLLTGSATPTWAGPPEIRAAIAAQLGEPFARSYIDPAGWQDVPIAGLVPRNATSAGRIADQALGILETFEASILPVETGRAA